MEKPETLVTVFEEPEDVKVFEGFETMPEEELKVLYDSLGLAMTLRISSISRITTMKKNTEIRP